MNQAVAPLLPKPFTLPMRLVPTRVRDLALGTALTRAFRAQIDDGLLDFLRGATLGVAVTDAGLDFHVTLEGDSLRASPGSQGCTLKIQGTLYDFLLLAARREDADTLFFQRRLKMQGDTEIGLELKNFLDGLELDHLPFHRQFEAVLERGIPLYERAFAR